jgi:GIY-YIG catalytic domain
VLELPERKEHAGQESGAGKNRKLSLKMPRPTKGTMIEGFISMWPREICDIRQKGKNRLFLWDFPELQKPGVYVLYRDDQPYYIGKSDKLRRRLHAHANQTTDRYYNFWNLFSAFVVRHKKYLNDVESILIAAMPTANSATPKMPKIKMPGHMAAQVRRIRTNLADPTTRKEFAQLLKMSRDIRRYVKASKKK